MKSRVTEDFMACFAALPPQVREQARKKYQLWKQNPQHPSLHFKRVSDKEPLYSVRVGSVGERLGCLRLTLSHGSGLDRMLIMTS